jgi:hypothetical protein
MPSVLSSARAAGHSMNVCGQIRCSQAEQLCSRLFAVLLQGQFSAIEIGLADLAPFSFDVGIVGGGEYRGRSHLSEKQTDDRRRPFGQVDLRRSLCKAACGLVALSSNIQP